MESSVFFTFDVYQTAIKNKLCWGLVRPTHPPTYRKTQLSAHVNHRSCSLQPSSSLPLYPPLGNQTEKKHKKKHEEETANLPTRKKHRSHHRYVAISKMWLRNMWPAPLECSRQQRNRKIKKKSHQQEHFHGTESLVKALRPNLPSKSSSHPGCRTGLSAPT